MADKVKVLIGEINDQELEYQQEKHLEAEIVDYDNQASTLSATDVRAAINELDLEKENKSEKGQPNGYASLDENGEVPLDELPLDDLKTSLVRNIYVALNGNDSTGDGSLTYPFASIGAAITFINANYTLSATENAMIHVAAGEYTEDTLVLPRFCSIWGQHYRTRIVSSATNIDLIQSSGANTIKGLLLSGVTNSSNYLIKINTTQESRVTIQDVSFSTYEVAGNVSNGIYINSSSGIVTVRLKQVDFENLIGNCVYLDNNAFVLVRGSQVFDCSSATYINANNNSKYSIQNLDVESLNVGIYHRNTGDSEIYSSDLKSCNIPLDKNNNSVLVLQSVAFLSENIIVDNIDGIEGFVLDEIENDDKYRVFNEFSVGNPGYGKESIFGEGDSYTNGMLVYTYDGTTYTDISEEAKSPTSSTFSFPSSGTTREIYIASTKVHNGTMNPILHWGIKASIATSASTDGEIVSEYWNGASWVEFNTMSTESSGSYFPHANKIFERTGSEQIRYTYILDQDWAVNDPVSYGSNLYWARFRAVTVPTTLPVFEQFKLHTNRTEINSDGFMEYFGQARPVRSITLPDFYSAVNSPADRDIFIQDDFAIGKIENKFVNNSIDQSSILMYLPSDIDTSCPIDLHLVFFQEDGNNQSVDWTIRWIINRENDPLYPNVQDAPTTNPNIKSKNVSAIPVGDNQQTTLTVQMDIPEFLASTSNHKNDILGIQIQRNGNTDNNNGDITLIVAQLFYVAHNQGGHIDSLHEA